MSVETEHTFPLAEQIKVLADPPAPKSLPPLVASLAPIIVEARGRGVRKGCGFDFFNWSPQSSQLSQLYLGNMKIKVQLLFKKKQTVFNENPNFFLEIGE